MLGSETKILKDPRRLAQRAATLPRPVVFTNGCFDILHRGHVAYLEEARNLGAALIVGVNSEASAKRLNKGPGRPVNSLEDRMALLAALASVSLVVPFDDDTPLALIETIKPEHLVKGGDWPIDKIVGHDVVQGYGGKVHSIPFRFERSTSDLIGRIRGG